jgi:tetratricopeptide (TPR) repeat protein
MAEKLQAGVAMGAFWYHRGHMDKAETILKEVEVNTLSSEVSLLLADSERCEILGNVYRDLGRYKEARRLYETAEHQLNRAGEQSQDSRIAVAQAVLLVEQGWLLNKQEKLTAADSAMTAALTALSAAHAGAEQEALAMGRLGAVQHDEGYVAAAMTNYIAALRTELAPSAEAYAPDAFETLQNMAVGQRDLGKGSASISTIERAVRLQKQQLEAEEKINQKVEDKALMASLARSFALGAELLRGSDKSKCAKGLRWALEALALQKRVDGDVLKMEQADILNTIGNVQADLGRYADAGNSYKASLSIHEKLEPNGNTATTASVYGNLGSLLHRQGRFEEAVSMYKKSLNLQESVLAASNPDIAVTCNNLAVSLVKLGKLEDARDYANRAVDLVHEDLQDSNGDRDLFLSTQKYINSLLGKKAGYKAMRVQEQ